MIDKNRKFNSTRIKYPYLSLNQLIVVLDRLMVMVNQLLNWFYVNWFYVIFATNLFYPPAGLPPAPNSFRVPVPAARCHPTPPDDLPLHCTAPKDRGRGGTITADRALPGGQTSRNCPRSQNALCTAPSAPRTISFHGNKRRDHA